MTIATNTTSAGISGVVPWAAVFAGIVTLITIALGHASDRRERRRTLYSEAYRAALAWVEMLYRARRRDPSRPHELAAQFHKLQEDIDFYQGWITSESLAFGRAYRRLVLEVKALTFPEIQAAWAAPPHDPGDGFSLQGENHPPVEAAKHRFLTDLRDHLSPLPSRRLALRARYSDERWRQITGPAPSNPTTTKAEEKP